METQGAQQLMDLVLKLENLMVVVAVWVVVNRFSKAFPKILRMAVVRKVWPLVPLVLCISAMWLPGIAQSSLAIGDKILLGLVLGGAEEIAHKVLKKWLGGQK
jgi:hypothetical protein